ncbi:hypothetical protein Isop_1297 [Isosphaera pallida ATCC 43644]|uniref:Uncharacterized protein n=1 Tax=Isosphaera pallida (strain ATCC 43644 / DSM 9630 / IS1B) TaxID=575540 RepID=E8QWJ1_ISOPI|nr:hypothetical protein Isop_1297 [Isosphaera pallida ATCC 43644]
MTTIEPTYLIDLGNQQPGIQPLLSPNRALSGRTHVRPGAKVDHTLRGSTQVVRDELDTIKLSVRHSTRQNRTNDVMNAWERAGMDRIQA